MQQQRDFSLHGAIDLGARKAAAQRREQASRWRVAQSGKNAGGARAFMKAQRAPMCVRSDVALALS